MNKSDLPELAKESLKHLLDRKGEVIYSSHETLKKGDIYLMGLNPGGDGFITIRNHIAQMLSRKENSFLDESWSTQKPGQEKLQKRVCWLINILGYEIRKVCASNLIFETSKSSDELCFGLAGVCWQFHEHVIEIVQPKLLLTFGNALTSASPYFFLRSLLPGDDIEPIRSGHGDWKCRGFKTELNGRKTTIIGIPHLSYYSPENKLDINWIKEHSGVGLKN